MIVFNSKKFIDYVKDIYPSKLNVEKANKLDDQTNYLDLTFIIGNSNTLYTKLFFASFRLVMKCFPSVFCCHFEYKIVFIIVVPAKVEQIGVKMTIMLHFVIKSLDLA